MSQPPGPAQPQGEPPEGQPQQPYGGGGPYGYPQQQPSPYPHPYPPGQGYGPQPGYGPPRQPPHGPYGPPPYGPGPYGAGPYGYAPHAAAVVPGMPPLASWGARLGGTLLDGLMFFLVPTGLWLAGSARISISAAHQADDCDKRGIPDADCPVHVPHGPAVLLAISAILALLAVIFISYREGATGQTPGKRVAGVRLLKAADGSRLGFGRALGRRLLHILDLLACCIGWFWPLWDAKRQTFADKLTKTVVIKDLT
ncbi:RDD family protein [Streptomyces sp. NBC_01190]|uniref:RDD family protein n=1 Tax=Streptomyces sp. NBC_01190 TaxID=2903767 RepID=UPI00386A4F78|nr:RDD family protein [Streptomyces sp. NBC_01190]